MIREHQLVRYGSILNKVLLDKTGDCLYQNVNLDYISKVIDTGVIPKVYEKNKAHSFDKFILYRKKLNVVLQNKEKRVKFKKNLNKKFEKYDKKMERKERMKQRSLLNLNIQPKIKKLKKMTDGAII